MTRTSYQMSSKQPTILERIQALDRSTELSYRYTPLVVLDTTSNSWVAVGNLETSFVNSILLQCRDEKGDSIFIHDTMTNKDGLIKNVFRMKADLPSIKSNVLNDEELFKRRTAILDNVTNQLLSLGVISQKHTDVYPVSVFENSMDYGNQKKLALVNRSTAPYLGIDSVGVHLHCYVCQSDNKTNKIKGLWLAKRAATKSHHPNYWDTTVAGGQPVNLSLYENIIKEAHEEAGVPSDWLCKNRILDDPMQQETVFSDHSDDPLTMTTAKPDGSCLKRSIYYSFDLQVPDDWAPTAVDGEVSEFKLYSIPDLEEELRYGNSVRPAMRSVLLDFMMRHNLWVECFEGELDELRKAMRRKRMMLW